MRRKLYQIVWLFVAFFIVSCEDLEDTYDKYAGHGVIRYVGKCSDLEVQPGWNRLKIKWKGNLDAAVERVKITWKAETDIEPNVRFVEPLSILEHESLIDSIFLENLSDAVYTVTVSNLSADSSESIVEYAYARPYTENHEDLRTFTRGIINFYKLGGKLVVFLDEDNENLKEVKLCFWGTDEKEYIWNIKDHMNKKLSYGGRDYAFLLPEEEGVEIDFSKPLLVKRRGTIVGCIDEINFKDEPLSLDERVWSAGFIQCLMKNYGEVTDEAINSVETIELDYDMLTLQDLFYFPNLKKVILGKNRYMKDEFVDVNISTTDAYLGLVSLQFLKDVRGVNVERYNTHYFKSLDINNLIRSGKIKAGLIEEKGNTNLEVMPNIVPLDTTGWSVTCSDTTYNGYKTNGASWLLDHDAKTYFEPGLTSNATIFEVKFDMKKPTMVKGFKVVQPSSEITDIKYLLASLKIEVSEDGFSWENATHEDGGILIGNTPEEITFINIPEILQKSVRYIRLTMANQQVNATSGGIPLFSLRLGDFIPF